MTWSGPVVGFREYSDIEIQQMMGRAGRPQYDSSGVVIVSLWKDRALMRKLMCDKAKESKVCTGSSMAENLSIETCSTPKPFWKVAYMTTSPSASYISTDL